MELLMLLLILAAVIVVAAIAAVTLRSRRRVGGVEAPTTLERTSLERTSLERTTLERTKVDPPARPAVRPAEPVLVPTKASEGLPPIVERDVREVVDEVPHDVPHEPVRSDPEQRVVEEPVVEPVVVARPRFRDRLGKARGALGGYFGGVLGRDTIDQSTWDDLEEALIVADVGPQVTNEVLAELQGRVKKESIKTPEELMEALKADLKKRLAPGDRTLRFEPGVTNVWLFVGVNGVGKTTTIGKIAKREIDSGRPVLMAAGDTFRAAAADQLEMWAQRSGAGFMRGAEGGDPASVIYDGVKKASASGTQLVLADTAGRLQTKTNLMEELSKIRRVADREPGQVTETLLVLDATTGQNGLSQAEQFRGAADITGVVLTKLDGTAKGGIAFAIQTKLGIPIKLVGLGEQVEDLVPFDPDEYVDALFSE
jgi:fused signal recognition particle receptor